MYKKAESWKMFNQISRTYDLLNNILSCGIHHRWKSFIQQYLPKGSNLSILDIATGTGDIIFKIMDKRHDDVSDIKGMDLSSEMMAIGKTKCSKKSYKDKVTFIEGDACAIPFDNNTFDAITISFGIRNVADYKKALIEMKRSLKANGKLIILESSIPESFVVKIFYLLYFRYILPAIGGLISGKHKAYKYLNKTTESFPCGAEFKNILHQAGFSSVIIRPLSFGISSIYIAKP